MPGSSAQMEWSQFVESLKPIENTLAYVLGVEDSWLRQEAIQQMAMSLSQAYALHFSDDPQRPHFAPLLNPIIKSAAPNPDYMYRIAFIDDLGTYRISGQRGTNLFTQVGVGSGLVGVDDIPGPPLVSLELDEDLTLAPDGKFSFIVSPERPEGYEGDWVKLEKGARTVNIREASYDWLNERDGVFSIVRLDAALQYRRWSEAEIAHALERIAGFPERYAKIFVQFVRTLEKNPVNAVSLHDWSGIGGLKGQTYYEGLFEIAEDEALILETEIPQTVQYWSVLLADRIFNTIEWEKCQSSINGHQATLDSDGKFRAVISIRDPGVPNWLETAGRTQGVVQGRWLKADTAPVPTLKRVKVADVRAHLPAGTPVFGENERREQLLKRWEGGTTSPEMVG
ncbi:DUF1214 domain-containing protein [Novosphingobium sp. G106]|uniref:DUF1214 domain-containing protein n=1 Tax=Novosphingobium sp. G106 TaxID=2849500 RepID=UPI001C2CD11C|nr:DUF1214 domain-containing protein [Novosphingobium sp. G106]MBV1688885.1 DUF1214 domain-containing protein [Novosphingobium sp. G106]